MAASGRHFDHPILQCLDQHWECRDGDFALDHASASRSQIVVTHAHLDHYPRVSSAPRVRLIATPATHDIFEARRMRRSDTAETWQLQKMALPYHQTYVTQDIELTLLPAGHMLGAAQALVKTPDGRHALFTGDIQFQHNPTADLLVTPQVPIDLLVIESTFGEKETHANPSDEIRMAFEALPMPAMVGVYAAGKAQRINQLLSAHFPDLPVMVDPEIQRVHRVYEQHGRSVGHYEPYRSGSAKKLRKPYVRLVTPHTLHQHHRDEHYRKFLASGWDHRASKRWLWGNLSISDHAAAQELITYVKALQPKEVVFWHGKNTKLVEACTALGIKASGIAP